MAIPTLFATGTGAFEDNGAFTVPVPAGDMDDKFMLLVIETNGGGTEADPNNPSYPQAMVTTGWTLIGSDASQNDAFADQTRLTAYYKRGSTGETDPTVADPAAANHAVAFIAAYADVDWVNGPVHKQDWGKTSTNDTTVNAVPQVTTTLDDCLIVSASSAGDNSVFSAVTNSTLATPAIAISKQFANEAGTDGAILVCHGGLATPGASGATTATISTTEEEANLTIALPGLESTYQFAPPTFTMPLNDESVNHSKRWSMWRHYSGVIPTPYVAIITGGVSNTAPGVVSPTTWDEKGNPEVPNAEYSQVGADDGSGDAGKAVFTGGSVYTITSDERESLVTGGYGAYIT